MKFVNTQCIKNRNATKLNDRPPNVVRLTFGTYNGTDCIYLVGLVSLKESIWVMYAGPWLFMGLIG